MPDLWMDAERGSFVSPFPLIPIVVTCMPYESVQLTGPTENCAFSFLFIPGSFLLDPHAGLSHPELWSHRSFCGKPRARLLCQTDVVPVQLLLALHAMRCNGQRSP